MLGIESELGFRRSTDHPPNLYQTRVVSFHVLHGGNDKSLPVRRRYRLPTQDSRVTSRVIEEEINPVALVLDLVN